MILHLHATESALAAALDAVLAAAPAGRVAVELGRGLSSVPRLLEEADAGIAEVGALGELLLLDEALRTRTAGTMRPGPRAAARLRPIIHALRVARVAPLDLRELAPRLSGRARADAAWLSTVLSGYERLLAKRRDEAAAIREALQRLARDPVRGLADVELVVLHATALDPVTRGVVEALVARGLTVRCETSEPSAPPVRTTFTDALADAAAGMLATLEAVAAPRVERLPVELDAGPTPQLVTAASPQLEARELARRIADRVRDGLSPDEVVVVVDEPARAAAIAAALGRYHIPVEGGGGAAAIDAEVVRLALSLLRAADDGVPRDRLLELIASRYVSGARTDEDGFIPAGRVLRRVREAVPASARGADHDAALGRWVAGRGPAQQAEAEAVRAHVAGLVRSIAALPATGSLAAHTRALATLLTRLGVTARARSFRAGEPPSPGSLAAAALARDQAGLRELDDLLELLPRAAAQAGLAERSLDRRAFRELLEEQLAEARLGSGPSRGAAVRVCPPEALAGRRAALVVLAAAEEGGLPRVREDDPILPHASRQLFNRALDRAIFAAEGEPERRALLALAQVRASAQELVVSWARADAEGRPLLPGPLVEDARARGADEVRTSLHAVPEAGLARHPDELFARLFLEEEGEHFAREGLAPAARAALRASLAAHDPARLQRIDRLSGIERARAAFFAGQRPAGRHDGRVLDEAVRAALTAGPLPGGAVRALSASTISRYAECPQRFFLESVLRLRNAEALHDDLDDLQRGTLAHLALERLFRLWGEAGLFPLRGDPAEEALIPRALEEAVAAFSTDKARGHELVFPLRVRAVTQLLTTLWRYEHTDPPASGARPTHFELAFEGVEVAGAPGEQPLRIDGSLDRVDIGGGRSYVFDYKSGKLDRLKKELKPEAFGDTSWQLPLYAAVVRRLHGDGAGAVLAGYYSLRDAKAQVIEVPPEIVLEPGGDPEHPTFGDRLWGKARAMREGRFEVAPRDGECARCRLHAVCRVVERDPDAGEVEGGP